MLKKPELFQNGYHLSFFTLSPEIRQFVEEENWIKVDEIFKDLTLPSGELYQFLQTFHHFKVVEFIISVRDANNQWEEDGIWHDDGSRFFAFSLSLTINSETIEGGSLGIRRKGEVIFSQLMTPSFGGIILFLTGCYEFEHKIHKVRKGKRVIIAGWCS